MPLRCTICNAPMRQDGYTRVAVYPSYDCIIEEKTRKLYCPFGHKQAGESYRLDDTKARSHLRQKNPAENDEHITTKPDS